MKKLHCVSFLLLVIGGLNWGLFGIFGIDLVAYLPSILAKIVYILVGLSAISAIVMHKKGCGDCSGGTCPVEEHSHSHDEGSTEPHSHM